MLKKCFPTAKMFLKPSKMIIIDLVSFLSSHVHMTWIIPFSTRTLMISGLLLAVEFESAQMASLWTSRASVVAKWMSLSIIPCSIIYFTWFSLPAHTFESVQAASFQIIYSSFESKGMAASRNPHWITISVYSSDPVTKLPIVLNDGMTRPVFEGCIESWMTLGVIPASIR